MNALNLSLNFHSYWHCGKGRGIGDAYDAAIETDEYGLPFVPGKTFRGVFRECVLRYLFLSNNEDYDVESIFGSDTQEGILTVSDFKIEPAIRQALITEKLASLTTHSISATAIDPDTGSATKGSLRTSQVALPLELRGQIGRLDSGAIDEGLEQILNASLPFLYIGIGSHRRRGLGRVRAKVLGLEQ